MRKRGTNLGSPEANFMFGGPDNEQIYDQPDGKQVAPYDQSTAAIDTIFSGSDPVPADQIISRRDKLAADIGRKIPDAEKIERQRREVADAFNGQLASED